MSAFIVSKQHIHVLVHALRVHELIGSKDRDAVGHMLWTENHRSVNYRYTEQTPVPDYEYDTPSTVRLSPTVHYKALQCYVYQSCEHDEWETSEAKELCDLLDDKIRHHCSGIRETQAYSDAPWGI